MDGVQASCLYPAIRVNSKGHMSRRCGQEGGGVRGEAFGMSLRETACSADLGGSSKYSNENFEDRSGERFHVNSSWTGISRCYESETPFQSAQSWAIYGKGIKLLFVNQNVDILRLLVQICGNATELGAFGKSPGKSSLFLLKTWHHGIILPGDMV